MSQNIDYTRPLTWFVLKTTSLSEAAVARRIKRRLGGVHDEDLTDLVADTVATFVAKANWMVRHRGKRIPKECVVLPGYLFVGFALDAAHPEPPWFDLWDVPGLLGVLARDGAPIAFDAEFVGEIISKCVSGFYNPNAEPMIQRGMRVMARSGRFRGVEGDVVTMDKGRLHADVVMELLGRVPVRLRVDDLVSVAYRA